MSVSINLHSADSNSVSIRSFEKDGNVPAFATVTVRDIEKNSDVCLYFANLGEVLNFSLMVQQEIKNVVKTKK